MSAPRVLIVSNRLPVGIATDAGTGALTPSTGTLATALREPHQRSGGLWIGWPGNSEPLAPADRQSVTRQLADLRAVGIDIVTIGQYLRPTTHHLPVARWVEPATFAAYKAAGEAMGIPHVESSPLTRSSYHARQAAGSSAPPAKSAPASA